VTGAVAPAAPCRSARTWRPTFRRRTTWSTACCRWQRSRETDVVYDLGCGRRPDPDCGGKEIRREGRRVGHRSPHSLKSRTQTQKRRRRRAGRFSSPECPDRRRVIKATVVTLYLLSSSNERLRPMLNAATQAGARIVSHAFSMGRIGRPTRLTSSSAPVATK
jgi:hypothetical protein